jgi:hypothetical protein
MNCLGEKDVWYVMMGHSLCMIKKDDAAELKKVKGIEFKGWTCFLCFHTLLHHEDVWIES